MSVEVTDMGIKLSAVMRFAAAVNDALFFVERGYDLSDERAREIIDAYHALDRVEMIEETVEMQTARAKVAHARTLRGRVDELHREVAQSFAGVALTRAFARTDIVPDMDREIERLERAYAAAIVLAAKTAPAVTPSGLAADPDDDEKESLVPALEASVEAVQAQKGAA